MLSRKTMILLGCILCLSGCGGKTSNELYAEGIKEMQKGNTKGAIVYFKNALEKNQNYLDARYQLARSYMLTGKYDQAEKEFLKVQRQNPSLQDIKLDLAKLYNLTKKPDMALVMAKDYLAAQPASADALEALGVAYSAKDIPEEAESSLLRALATDPGKQSTKLELARFYTKQGKSEKARALLQELIKGDRNNSQAYYLLADIELSCGAKGKALKLYQELAAIHTSDTKAIYKAALISLDMGDIKTAEKSSEDLMKRFPKCAEGQRLRGIVCYQQHNYTEAISALQDSLKIQPSLAGYFFLGLSLYDQGELENALSQFRIILDKDPSFSKARLLSGTILLRQGRVDDSIAEINRLLETDSKNALAHNVLGSAYMAKGMFEEGIRELNLATELDPSIIDAHLKKGIFHLSQGRMNEGEADLKTAIKVAPEILNTRLLLASYYMQKKNNTKALEVLKEGLRGTKSDAVIYSCMAKVMFIDNKPSNGVQYLQSAKRADPEALDPYFALATHYALNGSNNKAFAEYTAALQKNPGNVKAIIRMADFMEATGRDGEAAQYYRKAKETRELPGYLALANYFVRKGDVRNSIAVLDEASTRFPRTIAVLERKGRLQIKAKQLKDALKTFDDIEQISPERGIPLKIEAYMAMNKPSEALQEARRAITLKPNSPNGYLLIASIYRQQNNYDRAIDAMRDALRADPRNAQAAILLAELYSKTGNYTVAMKTCEDVLHKYPEFVPAFFTQGVLLDSEGKKNEAVKKYQRALTIASNYMPALNNLANLFADGYGSKEEALRLAEAAVAQDPENPGVLDTLGYVQFRNGRLQDARVNLERAASLLPENPTVKYHLALAYKAAGEKDRAVAMLQKALRSADFAEARQAQILLTEMN